MLRGGDHAGTASVLRGGQHQIDQIATDVGIGKLKRAGDQFANAVAALNVAFNRARLSKDSVLRKFLPPLQKAAEQMTRSLSMRDKDRV